MKQSATRELFTYWNDLRGERSAPERGDIDPAAIRNVLADTFMLDVDMPRGFPFRLAGTRINGLFDAEQKGRGFLSLWRVEERSNIATVMATVADGACPVVAGASAGPAGQTPIDFEILMLPLRHHGRTHSRILGMFGTANRTTWLGLLPIGPLALKSLRIVDTARHEVPDRIAVGQEITLGAGGESRGKLPSTRPFLRVIQGGR